MPAAASIVSASTATCSTRGSRRCSTTSRQCARLRLAACLLADVAWQANPGFRADRGIEMALHGNWVAVNPAGRVIMAQALCVQLRARPPARCAARAAVQGASNCSRAHCWGSAMRLGQRLSGGVGSVLKRTSLSLANGAVQLTVRRGEEALIGDQVAAPAASPRRIALACEPVRRHHLAGVAFRIRRG